MPFNPMPTLTKPSIEAYRKDNTVYLVVEQEKYQLPLATARTVCDLLAITAYDESIVALMAKRRRLTMENEELKEKLQNVFQYFRRTRKKDNRWKRSH